MPAPGVFLRAGARQLIPGSLLVETGPRRNGNEYLAQAATHKPTYPTRSAMDFACRNSSI
jgi:hypothetical protein